MATIEENGLLKENLVAFCADGAPVMGTRQSLSREGTNVARYLENIAGAHSYLIQHCAPHRLQLAAASSFHSDAYFERHGEEDQGIVYPFVHFAFCRYWSFGLEWVDQRRRPHFLERIHFKMALLATAVGEVERQLLDTPCSSFVWFRISCWQGTEENHPMGVFVFQFLGISLHCSRLRWHSSSLFPCQEPARERQEFDCSE